LVPRFFRCFTGVGKFPKAMCGIDFSKFGKDLKRGTGCVFFANTSADGS